jgi:hypothetical protein
LKPKQILIKKIILQGKNYKFDQLQISSLDRRMNFGKPSPCLFISQQLKLNNSEFLIRPFNLNWFFNFYLTLIKVSERVSLKNVASVGYSVLTSFSIQNIEHCNK